MNHCDSAARTTLDPERAGRGRRMVFKSRWLEPTGVVVADHRQLGLSSGKREGGARIITIEGCFLLAA
jgi:hypothetical protein